MARGDVGGRTTYWCPAEQRLSGGPSGERRARDPMVAREVDRPRAAVPSRATPRRPRRPRGRRAAPAAPARALAADDADRGRDDARVELRARAALRARRPRPFVAQRLAVGAVRRHRRVRVGAGRRSATRAGSPRRPGRRDSRCRPSPRASRGRSRPTSCIMPPTRASIASPSIVWRRMIAHSSSSSGPALLMISFGTRSLPTSCRSAPNSTRRWSRSPQPELLRDLDESCTTPRLCSPV